MMRGASAQKHKPASGTAAAIGTSHLPVRSNISAVMKPQIIVKTKAIPPLAPAITSPLQDDNSIAARIPQPYRTSFSAVTAPKRSASSVGQPKPTTGSRARSSSPFQRRGMRLSLPASASRSTTPNYRTSSQMVNSNASRVSSRNASPATRHMSTMGVPVNVTPPSCYSSHNNSLSPNGSGPARGRVSRLDAAQKRSSPIGASRLPLSSPSPTGSSPSTKDAISMSQGTPSQTAMHKSHIPQPVKSILVHRSTVQSPTSNQLPSSIQSPLSPITPMSPLSPGAPHSSSTHPTLGTSPTSHSNPTDPEGQPTSPSNETGRIYTYNDPRIKKTIIQKDYTHCAAISYHDKKIQDILENEKSDDKPPKDKKGSSLPGSPRKLGRLSRATTMPENDSDQAKVQTHVKKSFSNSISNFFRKMSPSAVRRHRGRRAQSARRPEGCHQKSVDSLDSSSSYQGSGSPMTPDSGSYTSDGVPIVVRGRSKTKASPIKLFIHQLGRRSRESSGGSDKENLGTPSSSSVTSPLGASNKATPPLTMGATNKTTPPIMTDESMRILKSIESNTEKNNMYHNFKEKQSPRVNESSVLKPQALKALDINEKRQQNKISPPKTLNVRQVLLMNKNSKLRPYQLTDSAESIGQCSIDAGSEPSLSSRSNGHPPLSSPVTSPPAATSPFGILSPTSPTPVDTAVHYNHNNMHLQESKPQTTTTVAPPTEATDVFDLVQNNGDLDGQAPLTPNGHPPSYLKLSCALSGYSSYKSYGSPTSVNTSVNSSNGSLDNQQSVNNTRTGVSPKRHVLGKHNGTVSPCRESNEELSRTEDSVDSSVVTHKHAERKSQSLSARNTPAQKVVTDRARKSADYRQTSRQIEHTDDIPSREEAIIQNGPIQAFCEDDDVVLGRNDNCDIGSVENVEVVSGSDTITHTNIEDNSDQDVTIRTIPKLQLENDVTTTELDTPTKDGAHFMAVVAGVTETFKRLCDQVEQDLKGTMPDDVSGKLRVTVGQAHLLINKKFQQFIGLCEKNINEDPSVPFYTTCEDLAGFWDMVEIQVTDVMNSFHKIETLRKNNWVNNSPSPSVSAANLTKPISPRSKTAKTSATQIAAQPTKGTPKSSRATEAQKARQEARKRLLAMKRAGRQRKISQSEESENIVEIYVPE